MIGGDSGAIRAGKAFVEILADDLGLQAGLGRASTRLRSWAATTTKIGLGLITAGGGILAPLLLAGKQAASFGDGLNDVATRTGLSIEAITGLSYAADLSSASLETLEGGLRKMQAAIAAAAKGGAQGAAALSTLGLSVTDLLGLNPDEQLGIIADRLMAIEDPGMRAAAAMKILGKSGVALLPMLSGGSQGLLAMRQEADRLGLTVAARAAAAVGDVDDLVAGVGKQFVALKTVVGAAVDNTLRPLLIAAQPLIATWIRWADANRGLVSSLVIIGGSLAGAGVAMVIAGTGATLLLTAFGNLIGIASSLAGAMLLPFTLPLKLAGAMVSVVGGVAAALKAATSVAIGFAGAAVSAFGLAVGAATKFGSVVGTLVSPLFAVAGAVTSVGGIVLGVVGTVASSLLGLAASAVTGIVGLIAAAVPIVTSALAAVAAFALPIIAEAIGGLLVGLSAITVAFITFEVAAVAAAAVIVAAWYGLGAVWGFVTSAAGAAADAVVSIARSIGSAFMAAGRVIASAFNTAWAVIASGASAAVSFLTSIPSMAASAFASLGGYAAGALGQMAGMWTSLKGVAVEAWGGIVGAVQNGDLMMAGQVAVAGLKVAWLDMAAAFGLSSTGMSVFFQKAMNTAWSGAAKGWAIATDTIAGAWATTVDFMSGVWGGFKSTIRDSWNGLMDFLEDGWLHVLALDPTGPSYDELRSQADHDRQQREGQNARDDMGDATQRQAASDAAAAQRKQQLEAKLAEIDKAAAATAGILSAAGQVEAARLAGERDKAKRELDDLVKRAKSGINEQGGVGYSPYGPADPSKARQQFSFDAEALLDTKSRFESRGGFNAYGSFDVPAFAKIEDYTKRAASAAERTADAVENLEPGLEAD